MRVSVFLKAGVYRAGLLKTSVSRLIPMTELIDQLKGNYLKGRGGGGGKGVIIFRADGLGRVKIF